MALLSDLRRCLPGYVERQNGRGKPQHENTDSISLLAPIDNDLGSQQQLDETIDVVPLTEELGV